VSLLLDTDELIELTHKCRPHAQLKVLAAMGIESKVRPDGTLAVSRAHVEAVLGNTTPATVPAHVEPNWGALAETP